MSALEDLKCLQCRRGLGSVGLSLCNTKICPMPAQIAMVAGAALDAAETNRLLREIADKLDKLLGKPPIKVRWQSPDDPVGTAAPLPRQPAATC